MNDMQKIGVFMANILNKLSDYAAVVAAYEARIAELTASNGGGNDNGGGTSYN